MNAPLTTSGDVVTQVKASGESAGSLEVAPEPKPLVSQGSMATPTTSPHPAALPLYQKMGFSVYNQGTGIINWRG